VEARAREAAENVAGQVQGTRCVVKNGVIDFSQQGEREKLQSAFSNLWAELSRNREQWPRQMQDFVARASQEDATGYEQSAALLVCGLLQTDVVCRGACEYPDDRKLTEMAMHVLATNMAAIDYIFTGKQTQGHAFDEPSPSLHLMQELQFANKLFERRTGIRDRVR
jgi:hypothetical protein